MADWTTGGGKSDWTTSSTKGYTKKLRKRHSTFGEEDSTNSDSESDDPSIEDKLSVKEEIRKQEEEKKKKEEQKVKEAEERAKEKSKKPGIMEKIGDLFEANSPQDQKKREEQGKPKLYQDQKDAGYKSVGEYIGDRFEANSPQDKAKRESRGEPTLYQDQKKKQKEEADKIDSLNLSEEDIAARKDFFARNGVDIEKSALTASQFSDVFDAIKKNDSKRLAKVDWKQLAERAKSSGMFAPGSEEEKMFNEAAGQNGMSDKGRNLYYKSAFTAALESATRPDDVKRIEGIYQREKKSAAGADTGVEQAIRGFGRGVTQTIYNLPSDAQAIAANALDVVAPEGSRVDKYAEERFKDAKSDKDKVAARLVDHGLGTYQQDNQFISGVSQGAGSVASSYGIGKVIGAGGKASEATTLFGKAKAFLNPGGVGAIFGINKAGEVTIEARDKGKDPLQAGVSGVAAGYFEAILENFGTGKLLNSAGSVPKELVLNSLTEGTQEFLQDMATSGVQSTYKDVDWNQALSQALQSGGYGAIVGGGAGSIASVSQNLQEQGVPKEDADYIAQEYDKKITSKLEEVVTPEDQQTEVTPEDYQKALAENGLPADQTVPVSPEQVTEAPTEEVVDQPAPITPEEEIKQQLDEEGIPEAGEQAAPPVEEEIKQKLDEAGVPEATAPEVSSQAADIQDISKKLDRQDELSVKMNETEGEERQAVVEESNQIREEVNQYNKENAKVELEVKGSNATPTGEVKVVEYPDGKFAVSNQFNTSTAGKMYGFSERFTTKEEAVQSAIQVGRNFISQERSGASAKDKVLLNKLSEQLDKLEVKYKLRKKGGIKPINRTVDQTDTKQPEAPKQGVAEQKPAQAVRKKGGVKSLKKSKVDVSKALSPLDEESQRRYGKPADKVTPTQLKDLMVSEKNRGEPKVIKSGIELVQKMGQPSKGYTMDESRPVLMYGGKNHGIYTDGYIAILDKKVADEVNDAIAEKQVKKGIKAITDPNMSYAEKEAAARKNIADQQKDQADKYPKILPGDEMRQTLRMEKPSGTVAKVVGYYSYGTNMAVMSDGKTDVLLNADLLAFMDKKFPTATYRIEGILSPVQVVVGNKVVGVIMPMKQDRAGTLPPALSSKKSNSSSTTNGLEINDPSGYLTATQQTLNIPRDSVGRFAPKAKSNTVTIDKEGEADVAEISRIAKNSFENDPSGVKTGGIERAMQEIENGEARAIRIRKLEDGTTVIEDGRHRIEAAKRLKMSTYPVEDVTSSYRSSHQINEGTPITDLKDVDQLVTTVKNKYGLSRYDQQDIQVLNKILENPEAEVTVYRASPVNELNSGDWVTTSKVYASDIQRQNGGKVYAHTVKASELSLPKNIEDNPSLARFSAFQYNKSSGSTYRATSGTDGLAMSSRLSQSKDPADVAMRESLAGKDRPQGAIEIEQNQNMSEEERLKATGGDRGQAGLSLTPEERAAFIKRARERAGLTTDAHEANKSSKREALAKTPEQLKELADQLNKAGQSGAILRKGQLRSKKNAGEFQYFKEGNKSARGKARGDELIKLRDSVIENPKMYVTVLAHELSHAIEYNVVGDTKNTYDLFGDLSKSERSQIEKELRAIVDNIETADVASSNPNYFYKPTEMLARYVETLILEPSTVGELAPLTTEKFNVARIQHPLINELFDAIEGNIDKGFRNKTPNMYRDQRQIFQKYLGKRVGDIAYDAEVVRRAEIQHAQKVIKDLIKYKFKNIKDDPALLFRAVEATRVTRDGEPEFGTRDIQVAEYEAEAKKLEEAGYSPVRKVIKNGKEAVEYAKLRYSPEEGKALFDQLTPEAQQLVKDFTAAKEEARDDFNRNIIKDRYKIEANIEGWVHRGLRAEKKGRMQLGNGKMSGRALRGRKAGLAKQRGINQEYLEDFQKQMEKALTEAETAQIDNDFFKRQLARISKPLARGAQPDEGWVEITADIKNGLKLPGEMGVQRGHIETIDDITGEKKVADFIKPEQRFQVPAQLAEHYRSIRKVPVEASKVSKTMQLLSKYWAINVLIHPGTIATNAISGGLQYAGKTMNDFYKDILSADFTMKQTRRNIAAPVQVLLPGGWAKVPDYVFGGHRSNFAGQFENQGIGNKTVEKYGDNALKLYGVVENYWKKAIALSDGVDMSNKEEVAGMITTLSKSEKELIAMANENVDLFAYDYDNVPMWLNAWGNKGGTMIKPFMKYPYKYSKMVTNLASGAFDQTLPWQERTAKVLTLTTMMALATALMGMKDDDKETPEGGEKTPSSFDPRGRFFIGKKGAEELFLRTAKYPFFNISTVAKALVQKDWDTALDVFNDQAGSVAPLAKIGLTVAGYKDQFSQYTDKPTVIAQSLGSYIPGFRILKDVGSLLDPVQRKQKGMVQAIGANLPIFGSEETKARWRGERKQDRIPVEPPEGRSITEGGTVTKERPMNRNDILLSFLTGLYVKRINPQDATSYKLRDERNAAEDTIRQLLSEGKESDAKKIAEESDLTIPPKTFLYYRRKRKK